ncbi:MAG: type III-B CRISPR module RAMP protein Cmr1 [Moraxella sp.]|nr:type III-B CRISPR module RAMP protein Cmr1 [Moraxella sp.]
MAIRQPTIDVPSDEPTDVVNWHSLDCELITPMYGGGVVSTKVDTEMPIRVSGIRGQLRFWWRLLAKHKWQLGDDKAITKAEFALWGGQNDKDSGDGQASGVLIRVSDVKNLACEKWASYEFNSAKREYRAIPTPKAWADMPYALFPAQGKRAKNKQAIETEPSELAKAGLRWTLKLAFHSSATAQMQNQVWETLNYWANFGGVGARTRRGLGAVKVEHDRISPISAEEVSVWGGVLKLIGGSEEACAEWKKAIKKLQSFRQVDVGRKTNSHRSKWTEPDTIRELTKQSSPEHRQRLVQGAYFPRAAFGLPIIFKFQKDGDSANNEPAQTSLQPVDYERMASPLILRPYFDGKQWRAMALVLPNRIERLPLVLKQGRTEHNVQYWDRVNAPNVAPIHEHQATDPLNAFLNYFVK